MSVGLESLHPMAYGLNRTQHQDVLWLARSNYTEAYIANRYNISVAAVREICAAGGLIPPRNEQMPDGTWACLAARSIEPNTKEQAHGTR